MNYEEFMDAVEDAFQLSRFHVNGCERCKQFLLALLVRVITANCDGVVRQDYVGILKRVMREIEFTRKGK